MNKLPNDFLLDKVRNIIKEVKDPEQDTGITDEQLENLLHAIQNPHFMSDVFDLRNTHNLTDDTVKSLFYQYNLGYLSDIGAHSMLGILTLLILSAKIARNPHVTTTDHCSVVLPEVELEE